MPRDSPLLPVRFPPVSLVLVTVLAWVVIGVMLDIW